MPRFSITRLSEDQLPSQLQRLEEKHGMSSQTFIERWSRGELDGHDYVVWSGYCQMAIRKGLLNAPASSDWSSAIRA